jgi:hypothetical protein
MKLQSVPSTDFNPHNLLDILANGIAGKENTDAAVPPAQDFEMRVQSFIKRMNNSGGQSVQESTERTQHRVAAESVLELVKVTEQLSKLERIAEQTRGCEPVSSDAKKWQVLSSTALDWSRKSLCDQQRTSIDKLSQLLLQSPGVVQAKPTSHVLQSPAVPQPLSLPKPAATTESEKPQKVVNDAGKIKATVSGFENGETLRTHLEVLGNEDPNRILLVRRINRLGFDSPMHLEKKFSEFGTVTRVFVAHSRVKPSTKRPVPRIRPAGLGFVLMDTAQDAHSIASSGPQMMINNVNVEVKLYQPGSMGMGKDDQDVNDEE